MLQHFLSLLICSFIAFGNLQASTILEDSTSIVFDLENCLSNSGIPGSASDYSEFTASVINESDCSSLTVIGDHLYRSNSAANTHSCTPGYDGNSAMCVSIEPSCEYDAGNDKSIKFDIMLDPSDNMTSSLKRLSFYEMAPESYDWINGPTGDNNYPTLYGLRIMKNGVVIYEESSISTENSWNQEVFDFSELPDFIINETTIFSFELLPYCPVGNDANVSVWDIDNIEIVSDCLPLNGGVISSNEETELELCIIDGGADVIEVDLIQEVGDNFQWVITDETGLILGLPETSSINLEGAGAGTCIIWHLAYTEGLEGLEIGLNANDFVGSFDLSNPITVVRNTVDGGAIELNEGLTEITICAGDDIPDPLDISLTASEGQNMGWIITDLAANILALPDMPPFDLDEAGAGTCLIWHISYVDGIEGLSVDVNAGSIEGCFDLSNPITVIRQEPDGGLLSFEDESTETTLCIADGLSDPIDVILSEEMGESFGWIITNTENEILALPAAPPFDLTSAGSGTCLLWHYASSEEIEGAEVGMFLDDLTGCYNLSNPLTVVRETAEGGMLSTADGETQLTICADDGESDAFDVNLIGSEGESNQWIITDDAGNILDLPTEPPFDLEGAGGGACLVWNLSYNGTINNLDIESNTSTLEGCFSLSNPITVTRLVGEFCDIFFCDVEGGDLMFADSTTSVTICAGDGLPDPQDVILTNEQGDNSGWIITDTDANILALPDNPPFDLDEAGEGVCLIWHVSYENDLEGLELGANAIDLEGCYDLSNPLTVIRQTGDDCDQNACDSEGGAIVFEDGSNSIEICASDSIPDPLNVILNGENGTNTAWIITDNVGNIIDLSMQPPFDMDGSEAGICLIWHIAYEDDLVGLEIDSNANDLSGCFDLSNPLSVIKVTGEACNNLNCDVDGGNLTFADSTMMVEICAGDSIADPLNVILTDEIGELSGWIITDANGNILALPTEPPFDFDDAGPGLCLIWHISYSGEVGGLAVDSSITNLEGCFDLSNQITVQRYEGDDCELIGCEAEGGFVSLIDTTFNGVICADDGIDDLIDVNVIGNDGEVSQWIIVEPNGMIIAVPATPPPFNLEGAGAGICLIYNISYDGLVSGIENGSFIDDIVGCYSLSNSVAVERLTGDDCDNINCDAEGGVLSFPDGSTTIEICADDGIPDPLEVVLSGEIGDSIGWIITDELFNILALPSSPPFDLEGAGEGTCLIWSFSMFGDVEGIEVDSNATNISGCFELSNPLSVIRLTGTDCDGFTEPDDDDASNIAFTVFPNPSTDIIYVTLDKIPTKKATVELYDANGKLIMSKIGREGDYIPMNMDECIDGIYYVRTISISSVATKRIIKIR